MPKWEYKVEATPSSGWPEALEKRLRKLGGAGWELVALVPGPKGAATLVLKRAATEQTLSAP